MSADELKQQGNSAFQLGDYDDAIDKFTKAIELDEKSHILYSNRSAAYLALGKAQEALDDAKRCVEIAPNWGKGYLRLGKAYQALDMMDEARDAYSNGLKAEPGNPLLVEASNAMNNDMMSMIFGRLFGPDMFDKLEANPETAEYLKDPQFKAMLENIRKNPSNIMKFGQNEKISKCLQVLSGITDEMMEEMAKQSEDMKEMPRPAETKKEEPVQEEAPISDEEKEIIEIKEEGSKLYRARKFEEAIKKYKEAANKIKAAKESMEEKTEENPAFKHLAPLYLNISAVYLTMHEFAKSSKWAKKAIDASEGNVGGFEFLSKCYVRIAKCEMQLGNYSTAVSSLKSAQMEYDSREIRNLIRECKTKLREKRKADLYSPEKALELKSQANTKFGEGNFTEAIKLYTEALTHDNENVDILNNRAFAYQKFGQFGESIHDCEEVIRIITEKRENAATAEADLATLKRSIVKAYIRVARTYAMMRKYHYSAHYLNLAITEEPGNVEAMNFLNEVYQLFAKNREAVLADRENNMSDALIKDLMADPQVTHAITTLQGDPSRLNGMLTDKYLGPKLNVLMLAGVL